MAKKILYIKVYRNKPDPYCWIPDYSLRVPEEFWNTIACIKTDLGNGIWEDMYYYEDDSEEAGEVDRYLDRKRVEKEKRILSEQENNLKHVGRVIKFRAWLKDKKIMLYPGHENLEGSGNEGYAHLEQVFEGHSCDESEIWDATDSILTQFTGLADRHGREIYEGDVCGYTEDPSRFVVVFEGCAFRKKYKEWDTGLEKPILSQWDVDNIGVLVVGNIYESEGSEHENK